MTHTLTFGPDQTAKGSPLHIAFGVNEHYVPAMGVTMHSIIANNPQTHIIFHVVAASLPHGDLTILRQFAEQLKVRINLYDLDKEAYSTLPEPGLLTYASYNRLFLCAILKDIATHVLYLDSDIVCLHTIPPLPELGDAIAAVVLDPEQDTTNSFIGRPASAPFFNSGVMYIDVKRWNENGITNKVIETILANRKYGDQDALNLVLAGQITRLEEKWNRLWNTVRSDSAANSDAVFLHYTPHRPWHEWSPAFLDPSFAKYFSQSPWPKRRLLNPVTRKHKGQYARYLFRRGNLPKALLWYVRFLRTQRKAAV